MRNKIVSINQAEAIFYPAFDKYLCDDSQITIQNGTVERLWDTLGFCGGEKFSLHWKGEVDLSTYDKIICFITFSKHVTVSGKALVDGKEVMIFKQQAGDSAPVELISPCINQKEDHMLLTEIILEFTSNSNRNIVLLSWFGLSASWREHQIEESMIKKDSLWFGLLNQNVAGTIHKNLVFSEEEALELKQTVLNNQELKETIRANADKVMHIEPEKLIREFAPVENHMYRFVRVRDRGRENLEGSILNLAIAGYVLEEAKYSNLAARMILSLIQMKWFEGPTCCMEGSKFHHVCFTEDHLSSEICIAMGFLGGVFTNTAILLIIDKIEDAWKWIRKKCMEQGYRSFMNQGIVGNRGAILGAYFLHLYKGEYEEAVIESYQRHTQIVENYLSEDGHCVEGGDYFEYSFTTSIILWHVYSRFVGKSLQEIVPNCFKRAGKYLEAILSTTSKKGKRMAINCDKGKELSTLLMIFMTMVCGFEEGNYYLTERFKDREEDEITTSFDLLFYQYYRKQMQLRNVDLPRQKEIVFKEEGLISYQFDNGKLIVTAERNPYTAHFHEDRGGIVLEAEGRLLLPDLGTTSYANPVCLLMDKKEYHNLACPIDIEMKAASEVGIISARNAAYNIDLPLTKEDMYTKESKILYASKTDYGYEFGVDTGMLYGKNIVGIRRGTLDIQQDILEIEDEWQFVDDHPLMITYISYQPWRINNNRANSQFMEIEFQTEEILEFELENTMVDCKETPVYVLHVIALAGKKHKVISKIQWKKET